MTNPMLRTSTPRPSTPALAQCPAALALLLATALLAPPAAQAQAAAEPAPWQVVGRQGLVQVVIVPDAQRDDLEAYQAQIARLCPPETTCFVNFHSNPSGAPVTELPLPDAVADAVTARFRRSMKNGMSSFQWRCGFGPKTGAGGCF